MSFFCFFLRTPLASRPCAGGALDWSDQPSMLRVAASPFPRPRLEQAPSPHCPSNNRSWRCHVEDDPSRRIGRGSDHCRCRCGDPASDTSAGPDPGPGCAGNAQRRPHLPPPPAPAAAGADSTSPASAAGAKAALERAATSEIENPYGLEALWRGSDWVAKATLVILVIMSMGTLVHHHRQALRAGEAAARRHARRARRSGKRRR